MGIGEQDGTIFSGELLKGPRPLNGIKNNLLEKQTSLTMKILILGNRYEN